MRPRPPPLDLRPHDFSPVARHEIVGIDNVLQTVDEVVDWLQHSQVYLAANAPLEPGILLVGPPGTGKTFVSRYIATVSNSHMINVQDVLSDGTLTGNGMVRDLFAGARRLHEQSGKPVILFWDEFNEYVRRESGSRFFGEASLSAQLISELDGVKGRPLGILLIACTNDEDEIPNSILRPGRIGLKIEFTSPNQEGKIQLFQHYLDLYPHANAIDVPGLAGLLDDNCSAAGIEEVVASAWRQAVRQSLPNYTEAQISPEIIQSTVLDQIVGPITTRKAPASPEDLRRVAIHEMGHALLAHLLGLKLRLVTLRNSMNGFGQTMISEDDSPLSTFRHSLTDLITACGGRAMEEHMSIPVSMGHQGDNARISAILFDLIDEQGAIFPISFKTVMQARQYDDQSQSYLSILDKYALFLSNQSLKLAHEILNLIETDIVESLAQALIRNHTLTGPQFAELATPFSSRLPTPDDVENTIRRGLDVLLGGNRTFLPPSGWEK